MNQYTVRQLAGISGVSVRTLHHYDMIGLLIPAHRTDAGYRFYGESQLLRLQQILFYKELDFTLKAIADILDDPEFDLIQTLKSHRKELLERRKRFRNQNLQSLCKKQCLFLVRRFSSKWPIND